MVFMEAKIAVIGDRASVMAFRTVGFDIFEAGTDTQISDLIASLADDRYSVIFITEELVPKKFGTADKYKNNIVPAIIPIPGRFGSMGRGIKIVHENVEKAIGADIFNK